MRQDKLSTQDGRGGPRARLGARAVAAAAALSLAMSLCPATMALARADEQSADMEAMELRPGEFEVSKYTHEMSTGTYRVTKDVTIDPEDNGNGIWLYHQARVTLIIDDGVTLTVRGADSNGQQGGGAAISVPESTTLIITGAGTLNATGGKAGNGESGGKAANSWIDGNEGGTGDGGKGGDGGGGAGAGIGSNGGNGGNGGSPAKGVYEEDLGRTNTYGNEGNPGSAGVAAEEPGTVIITGSVTVNATGGTAGAGGSKGGRGWYVEDRGIWGGIACGTSGGGGGGAGGSAADGIGSGGTGGGGGGSGASANKDGEYGFFTLCDLDDLWGFGGHGGSGTWGGSNGERGDYGASNGGDSTGASEKYAKAGGAGGTSAEPKTVPFYTYQYNKSSRPMVTCTSGHGVTRSATELGMLEAFDDLSSLSLIVTGGTYAYDGNSHGATVGEMSAQAEGEDASSGVEVVDGHEVRWTVRYLDEEGNELDAEPVMPGGYAAVVTFSCETSEEYNGDWVVPVTITKRQVALPAPAELTFECADWETGEGALQDALAGLDESDYRFVADAKAEDGTASARSGRAAGEYRACFRLTDPATCEWADGSGSAEAWVPWSIGLQEYDPNDPALTYWGAAHDGATTTVAYTGEPVWVRPWFAPAREAGGEFPAWVTHWADGRPTGRNSAVVVYLRGEDDTEGLVGYHTGEDGGLEEVTGAQVYAWMFGVDIDGEHVDVENGKKVWYKAGEGDEAIVLAVQDERPEGADGCVVARDLAYADRLGVIEEGTYRAYAYFDEGSGFQATAPAEATVVVKSEDTMLRLYNPNSGEHLYTADEAEKESLVALGWKYEGIGWTAPAVTNTPVYRLYNGNAGEHHYTASAEERDALVALGWADEGIGWYSGDDGVAVYREYNPNERACNHNYTKDRKEHDHLVSLGWKDEGVAWYGVAQKDESVTWFSKSTE